MRALNSSRVITRRKDCLAPSAIYLELVVLDSFASMGKSDVLVERQSAGHFLQGARKSASENSIFFLVSIFIISITTRLRETVARELHLCQHDNTVCDSRYMREIK